MVFVVVTMLRFSSWVLVNAPIFVFCKIITHLQQIDTCVQDMDVCVHDMDVCVHDTETFAQSQMGG